MSHRYAVAGIGNAIVDVLSPVEDHFLDHMDIEKGIMQLIERERAELLYAAMKERTEAPGGSVANTLAGIGRLGLPTAFMGRVRDDALGRGYAAAMSAGGTDFANAPAPADIPTSRCMIFVSPDGERSMNTYLGVSAEVGPEHVPEDVAGDCAYLFLEGYLFDKDPGKAAFLKAAELCHAGGGKAGIALSDPFCVNRHRGDFQKLIAGQMDYVIGNSHEWCALYETEDLDAALARAASVCETVICTRSGDPVWLIRGDARIEVPVATVVPVDATGAGDQFAAGLLYGLAAGHDLETAGRMGVLAAAEVIGHMGARPQADVAALFRAGGLV
ncbi:adenosine kinase [Mangrovicoccus algicola]|uniref:Adenosine kinase n=1 Tax=Mangrovicoccus algicola TaxID=2771008 RepID=A0A8J7CTP1_9RHOB|nr:adenosine kinase [Mangrovicoccus algicola]MBE3636914.1 adenosine kinase [Mangrovicoccus algicola]